MRILIVAKSSKELEARAEGMYSSFGPFTSAYQGLDAKGMFPHFYVAKKRLNQFKQRVVSSGLFVGSNPILSTSEISDIYHFPYTDITKTEDLVKSSSSDLPAPLSMKQDDLKFDVIVGKNTYGGKTTYIGLAEEDRWMHEVIYGGTGKGKSTLLLYQFVQDVENDKGLGLIDPHGDLAEEAVASIPNRRKQDLVYINPYEIGRPVAINILELTEGLSEDELEIEKEFVTESVVSLFRKEFSKEGEVHAHRLEYILRNCIYTAYTIKGCTIFTVYDLLNDPTFRRNAIKGIKDERLVKFWKNEVGKAGDMQRVKMAFGVTSKIGRFLFSPMAKRILDNKHSTINFDEILNGKILIANLSKGNIGDDTSELLGKMILTKIQLASGKRARIPKSKRRHFYLYIDEFQNFATKSFVDLMSRDRKFNVHAILVQQSTAQQDDENLTNLTLANAGIAIVFRTAAPKDEEMLLPLFYPHVKKGEIQNLPAYHFYMKISAVSSEEAFSGETIVPEITIDEKRVEKLKQTSRDKYTIDYHAKKKEEERLEEAKDVKTVSHPELKKKK